MLKALSFVSGALGKPNSADVFKNYHFKNNKIYASNSQITMCSPIPLDLECSVNGRQFQESVNRCKEAITIGLLPSGRMRVLSGKFRSFVDVSTDDFPFQEPEGEKFEIDGEKFVANAKRLQPYMSKDETRFYITGIYFSEGLMVATDGKILLECEQGEVLPDSLNIPPNVIHQIVKFKEYPTHIQASKSHIVLHYAGDRYIQSQLIDGSFPDWRRVLGDTDLWPLKEIHPELWTACDAVQNMSDNYNSVYLFKDCVRSSKDGESGAQYDVPDLLSGDVVSEKLEKGDLITFNAALLKTISASATRWGLADFPAVKFVGEGCRGAIMGMRG